MNVTSGVIGSLAVCACAGYIRVGATLMPFHQWRRPKKPPKEFEKLL
jgi:hypothetical protein